MAGTTVRIATGTTAKTAMIGTAAPTMFDYFE
jgi:hypothetical protein